MAAARANKPRRYRLVRLTSAAALAAACAACASGLDPGYSVVTQDRFDPMECPQLISEHKTWSDRERKFSELTQKAESSPGGIIVSVTAYRSELMQARTMARLAEQAMRQKHCDARKP